MTAVRMRTSLRAPTTRGFTLIELMVALVVLTVGLFSIIHLQVVTVRGHSYARQRNEATMIALQVGEEMRKDAQEWVDNMKTGPVAISSVFPDIAPEIVGTPAVGGQLTFADLRALPKFNGMAIASGPAVVNSWLINIEGFSPDSGTATAQEAVGAIYRVHYVAHYARLDPLAPANTLLRITVLVSWDNKDVGEGYGWTQWATEANFWKRHMVAMTFYLPRSRHW